jgi:hypothetical protein
VRFRKKLLTAILLVIIRMLVVPGVRSGIRVAVAILGFFLAG